MRGIIWVIRKKLGIVALAHLLLDIPRDEASKKKLA
jgi:hypothetical protein